MSDTNDKNAEVEMDSENNNKSENQQEKIREIRLNPEALSDLPTELFLRLVGLFNTIPADHLKDLKYLDNATKFQELKVFIETELASEDGKNFAKSELADYVHNLYLLLVGVMPLDHLEANIENIRREYQNHVDDLTYKAFLNTELHLYIDKYSRDGQRGTDFNQEIYEDKLRAEYRNLVNENRRAKLAEGHIEVTRSFLIAETKWMYFKLIIGPAGILLTYIILTGLGNYYGGKATSSGLLKAVYQTLHQSKGDGDLWFNVCALVALFSLNAIAGATGSLISVILRIQGVRDNNQLAQNIFAFKYSVTATKLSPVLGMVFALVLSLLFAGHIISGSVFPFDKEMNLNVLITDFGQITKWIIWGFIAGFSERLVPDMVDQISEKAKKADKAQ